MTYAPPDKVRLLGKEAYFRSTGVVDYYEARMDALPIEATVSRASRTGEVYAVIECGYDGDGQPVASRDKSTTVESAVSWANAKVRELLTEALREIEEPREEHDSVPDGCVRVLFPRLAFVGPCEIQVDGETVAIDTQEKADRYGVGIIVDETTGKDGSPLMCYTKGD